MNPDSSQTQSVETRKQVVVSKEASAVNPDSSQTQSVETRKQVVVSKEASAVNPDSSQTETSKMSLEPENKLEQSSTKGLVTK